MDGVAAMLRATRGVKALRAEGGGAEVADGPNGWTSLGSEGRMWRRSWWRYGGRFGATCARSGFDGDQVDDDEREDRAKPRCEAVVMLDESRPAHGGHGVQACVQAGQHCVRSAVPALIDYSVAWDVKKSATV